MSLPQSLHIPWCRYIARRNKLESPIIRRYCFGDTYAYQENNMITSYKTRFDIVIDHLALNKSLNESKRMEFFIWHEAEVLKVTEEVVQENTTKGNYKIVISSTLLIDYVFGECNVTDELRIKIYKFLRKAFQKDRRSKFSIIKTLIKTLTGMLSRANAEKLANLINVQGRGPADLDAKMTKVVGFRRTPLWDYAISQLECLFQYCQMLNLNTNNTMIDMTLMPDSGLIYHSGMIFTVVQELPSNENLKKVEQHIIAIGGRYDNTLHQYTNPINPKPMSGVGVDIFCDVLAKGINKEEDKRNEVLLIFEPIFGKSSSVDKECMWLLQEAWKKNIPAKGEFYGKRRIEEWVQYAQTNNVKKLVVVKQQTADNKYLAMIRNIEAKKKEEVEVSNISELADYVFEEPDEELTKSGTK